MYAVIWRFVANLASSPSEAAWNIPRQRSSGRSPPRPGSNDGVTGSGVTGSGRRPSTLRPDGGKGPSRTLWYRRRRMQTALQRRQRHRRQGAARRGRGGGSARRAALAIPLLLFSSFIVLGGVGFIGAVSAYSYYSRGLPDPAGAIEGIGFEQPSIVYDRTGTVQLAKFGVLRRELVAFNDIPPEM